MKKIFTSFLILINIYLFQSCVDKIVVADSSKQDGKIVLKSEPSGAQIFLLGTNTNKVTPDSIIQLKSGDYDITLKKANYKDTLFVVKVYDSLTTSKNIALKSLLTVGSIFIVSEPAGAEIFLDSNRTNNTTPDTITNLIAGQHQITLKKENYKDTTLNIIIKENQVVPKTIILTGMVTSGNIFLNSSPDNAQIYLDSIYTNKVTADTLKNLTTGEHQITLKKDNYDDTSFSVTVEANKTVSKSVSLTRLVIKGNIFLDSEPAGAQIFLDDINTNRNTPDTLANIAAGSHTIKLTEKNYRDTTFQINVVGYLTISKKVVLTSLRGGIFIESSPYGAGIFINDNFTNKTTPDTIKNLVAGKYKVTLKYQDYNDTTFYVDVGPNTITNTNIILTKIIERGDLYIWSDPSGAEIFLNNKNQGKVTPDTIKNLEVGSYNITLKLADYLDTSFAANIEKDFVTEENITLKEQLPVDLDTLYYGFILLGQTRFTFAFNQNITLDKVDIIEPGSSSKNSFDFGGNTVNKGSTRNIYYPKYEIGDWQLIFYGKKTDLSNRSFAIERTLTIP